MRKLAQIYNRDICKPPPGTPLAWGNPDTAGLVGCWVFNEGFGQIALNAVNQNDSLLNQRNTGLWGLTQEGPMVLDTVSGTSPVWSMTYPSQILRFTGNFTMIWRGMFFGSRSGDNPRVFGFLENNTNASPYDCWAIYTSATTINASWNNGTTIEDVTIITSPALNVIYEIALVFASVLTIYLNGVSVATSSNVGPIEYSTTSELAIGPYNANTGLTNSGTLGAWIYNRVLTQPEIQSHYLNPYGCFNRGAPGANWILPTPTGGLFRQGNLDGLGCGGPFFSNPLA